MRLTDHDGNFARNKHVMIRRNYAREAVEAGLIKIKYMATDEIPADALTKAKGSKGLKANMKKIGLVEI